MAFIRLKLAVNCLCNSSETMSQPVNALGLMSTSEVESYTNQAALMQLNSIHRKHQQTSSNNDNRRVFSRAIHAIQEAIQTGGTSVGNDNNNNNNDTDTDNDSVGTNSVSTTNSLFNEDVLNRGWANFVKGGASN